MLHFFPFNRKHIPEAHRNIQYEMLQDRCIVLCMTLIQHMVKRPGEIVSHGVLKAVYTWLFACARTCGRIYLFSTSHKCSPAFMSSEHGGQNIRRDSS